MPMSKHETLTQEEFANYVPDKKIPAFLEAYRKKNHLKKEEMNILDWGCGRGADTLWLRDKGYNAYGVDIDSRPINNGMGLFQAKGYDESTLRQLSPEGKTDFPDDFFHVVISNQVFEHVSDIEAVAEETKRITRDGGTGYHIFPASKRMIEGHLFMPFIHWLPKNKWRKLLIAACVRLHIEPHWPELNNSSPEEKIDTYYQYSINCTFYRKPSDLKKIFRQAGLNVKFETINNPRLTNHKIFGPLLHYGWLRSMVNFMLLSFFHVELRLEK